MENKKNKILAIVLAIFALAIVTTAASFAFFTYSRVGETTSTIISGDIEFSFIEGDSATLANAFPVADSVGAVDTTGEYSFEVKLASSSNANKMNYNVLLVDNNDEGDTDYFNNEQIKFSLVKNNTYVAGSSTTNGVKLSDIDGFDELSNQGEGIVLLDQEITSGTTDNYKLRIWISDEVNYSNTQNGEDEQESIGKYNSHKYSLKVKVTSGITSSLSIKNLSHDKGTITANLEDANGLAAYAITTNQETPTDDEWIEITNDTGKNSVVRTASDLITSKRISYNTGMSGNYYLHVKNKLNEVKSEKIRVVIPVTYGSASDAIIELANTNINELKIVEKAATGQQNVESIEYRYFGKNPNNYIMFNNELWRIVGLVEVDNGSAGIDVAGNFEKRLKIVRSEGIGSYVWDTSSTTVNGGNGVNEWSQADLMTLLNSGAYYNRTTGTCYTGAYDATTACDFSETSVTPGLTASAKEMISDAKWYLGATTSAGTIDQMYEAERGTASGKLTACGNECSDSVTRKKAWIGKIGLLYPSDYGYSTDVTICGELNLEGYDASCAETSWLRNTIAHRWTLTPYATSSYAYGVFYLGKNGNVAGSGSGSKREVLPVTYLKTDINITSGIGTSEEPFIISN